MVLQSLLKSITQRNFRSFSKRTEKLDPQQRQNLQEFLDDLPEEQQELRDIEGELKQAASKLHALERKERFIEIRLRSYQQKLKRIPPPSSTLSDVASSNDDEMEQDLNPPPQSRKQEEHLELLNKVEESHRNMVSSISLLKARILTMEQRKLELQFHLEECQVVLDKAEELEKRDTELYLEDLSSNIDSSKQQEREEKNESRAEAITDQNDSQNLDPAAVAAEEDNIIVADEELGETKLVSEEVNLPNKEDSVEEPAKETFEQKDSGGIDEELGERMAESP
jgi:hypothetical protein